MTNLIISAYLFCTHFVHVFPNVFLEVIATRKKREHNLACKRGLKTISWYVQTLLKKWFKTYCKRTKKGEGRSCPTCLRQPWTSRSASPGDPHRPRGALRGLHTLTGSIIVWDVSSALSNFLCTQDTDPVHTQILCTQISYANKSRESRGAQPECTC